MEKQYKIHKMGKKKRENFIFILTLLLTILFENQNFLTLNGNQILFI